MLNAMSPVERAQAELDRIEQLQKGGEQQEATEQPEEDTQEEQEPVEEEAEEQPVERQEEDENSESYKKRWISLQGMHKGYLEKIERLTAQNKQLDTRLNRMESERPAQQELSATASTKEISEHLKMLSEEYGEDFSNALSGVVENLVDQKLKGVTGDISKTKQQLESFTQDSVTERQDRFKRDLSAQVDDWEDIFFSDEFSGWLDSHTEPLSGATFGDLFRQANNDWDLNRMVRFFESYKKDTGRVVEEKPDPRKKHLSPGRSKAGPNPAKEAPKRQWNALTINQFYEDVRRGLYVGKEAEAQALEQEIFAANAG